MCRLYAERWSSNDFISETQKRPWAHGMVSIISHCLGYWTKRVDTALQGAFCNKLEILPRDSPQAQPWPVPQLTPFLRWAQPHRPAATAGAGMQWDACWSKKHSHSPPTALEVMWNQRKSLIKHRTSKCEMCQGSASDLSNFIHVKWRISLYQKNKEAERQKYQAFSHLHYRGLYTNHCLAAGISLIY